MRNASPVVFSDETTVKALIAYSFPLLKDMHQDDAGAVLSMLSADFGPGELARLLAPFGLETGRDVNDVLIPFADEVAARQAASGWLDAGLVDVHVGIDLWVARDGDWQLAEFDILDVSSASH